MNEETEALKGKVRDMAGQLMWVSDGNGLNSLITKATDITTGTTLSTDCGGGSSSRFYGKFRLGVTARRKPTVMKKGKGSDQSHPGF